MIYSLVLMLVSQLPMNGITSEQPAKLAQPVVITKEVVVTKKIYVMLDKFGEAHENESKDILIKEVGEANAKPFKMSDSSGQWWEHSDKEYLQRWIDSKNAQIEYNRQPSFKTILREDRTTYLPRVQPQIPVVSVPLTNCGPVG